MRSALYYPHTTIRSTHLLKSSLLLWDNVHVIVPWPEYTQHHRSKEAAEAFSLVGKCHFPSDDEKEHAHELVEDFIKRPLPPAFSYSLDQNHKNDYVNHYDIYAEKFLHKTFEMLRDHGMSVQAGRRNMRSSAVTGLALMNIVADCCAGSALARVTDEGAAYASLAGLLVEPESTIAVNEARETLVPMLIRAIDVKKLSLKTLINFRKREMSSSDGSLLRALRHRLSDKIEEQAKRLATLGPGLARQTMQDEFEADMKDDYRDLRDALKAKATETLATKEFLTAAICGAGFIATSCATSVFPLSAPASAVQGTIAVGGLIALKSKWVQERRKLLKEHPTAYLYEARGGLRL